MGGSGALFDGVAGLDNHQSWMNVIGNNIANVNTSGFKDNQFNFADVIYQTLKGASSAVNGGGGGTDFDQVGLGTNVGSIMTNEQQGSLQTTNLPSDFAIQGDGFFIVNDGISNHYTRDSNFIVDAFGNINQAATGFHLQGYGLKQIGNTVTIDNTKVVNLTVPQQTNPAQQTNALDLIGNLQSSATTPQTQSIGVYDSLGQLHNVVLTFTPSGNADGNWTVTATAADLSSGSSIAVSGGNAVSTVVGGAGLHFNSLGQLDGTVTPLVLTFSGGNTPYINASGGPTKAAQPWVIPGTTTGSNADQTAALLNVNDPAVGNLTQFASPTALQTQAPPDTLPVPSGATPTVPFTGNLNDNSSPPSGSAMATATFVAQDTSPSAATHTFQVGLVTTNGTNFTPTLLTVDGFSGVAQGNLASLTTGATTVGTTLTAVDSTGRKQSFGLTLVPISNTSGTPGSSVWSAFVNSVDGDPDGVPAVGNLQSGTNGGTATVTSYFTFSETEPDGINHAFSVKLSKPIGSSNWEVLSSSDITVDGAPASTGVSVATSTNVFSAPLTISVTSASAFGNQADETMTFDFSGVTNTSAASSVSPSVVNPTGILQYNPTTGLISQGGTLSIGVNANSLFTTIGTTVSAANLEPNAAEIFNFDFSPVTLTGSTSNISGVGLPAAIGSPTQQLSFGAANSNTPVRPSGGTTNSITIASDAFGDGNTGQTLTLDFSKLEGSLNPNGIQAPLFGSAGNSAGSLKDFNVDQTGIIHGVYTNGYTQTIGQILLATFENPAGLQREGKNLLQISADSGVVNVGTPGSGKFGTIAEGNIETSNVDLAQEFSNMILAERGFQANSRVITTADTMLSDLMGIKQTP